MEISDLRDLLQLLRQHRVTRYRCGDIDIELDLKSVEAAPDIKVEGNTAFRGVNPNYNHPSLGLAGRIKVSGADDQ